MMVMGWKLNEFPFLVVEARSHTTQGDSPELKVTLKACASPASYGDQRPLHSGLV